MFSIFLTSSGWKAIITTLIQRRAFRAGAEGLLETGPSQFAQKLAELMGYAFRFGPNGLYHWIHNLWNDKWNGGWGL